MSEKRIHSSLQDLFHKKRIIFWYDADQEWEDVFKDFEEDGVEKLEVLGNEFGAKVKVLGERNSKFLIYSPRERPEDSDNWLLDLVLQGHEFKADRTSLAIQEVGLPYEFRSCVEQHLPFFRSGKRSEELKALISKDDDIPDLRLKMMAVLAKEEVQVDAMLLKFLDAVAEEPLLDPVADCFDGFDLTRYFWKEVERLFGYGSAEPGAQDFLYWLFKGANPLNEEMRLSAHGKVFIQRWKDSNAHNNAYKVCAGRMEDDLQVAVRLEAIQDLEKIATDDTFEIVEKFLIHRGCRGFEEKEMPDDLLRILLGRRQSFWYPKHRYGFEALEKAIELRSLVNANRVIIDSVDDGLKQYVSHWWKIDQAYRQCTYCLRQYGEINVMGNVTEWVEKTYVNGYLLPLNDLWSDKMRDLRSWKCGELPAQREFYDRHVAPFTQKKQKVFVVISDALRYEAAQEFADRIESENRWTTERSGMFASLPTYTQLGMASLLPGKEYEVDENSAGVKIDGRSATGTENRSAILREKLHGRGIAIQYEEFIELNTKTDGRALMKGNDVIYIYHNKIDKVGHSLSTEAQTVDAVEQSFEELTEIVKKVANINGTHVLLAADHGFIFQQKAVDEADSCPLPEADLLCYKDRRFALGKGIRENPGIKVFNSSALGLGGDWEAAFPLSLGRFPLKGSGKRFVHGGLSLQESVVPVIYLHKTRKDDVGRVGVELMQVPAKITTGRVAFSLYQVDPVSTKLLGRKIRVGVYAQDGTPLSEVKTLDFDSDDSENRNRETNVILILGSVADNYNNKDVEIRLEEVLPNTEQKVLFKTQTIRIQKPFTTDFDEL